MNTVQRGTECLRLVTHILPISAEAELRSVMEDVLGRSKPTIISFLNAHAFNLCWLSSAARRAFLASDVLLRDGVGIKWAMRLFGCEPGLNANGTDAIPYLLSLAGSRSVALYGTQEPYLGAAAHALKMQGVNVASTLHGFLEPQAYKSDLANVRPAIIVLAMGMPKQETMAVDLRDCVDWPCTIVNGGAILDFIGGKVRRAPRLLNRLGFEWAYRLMLEPRRLAKRYLIGNVLFLCRIALITTLKAYPGIR